MCVCFTARYILRCKKWFFINFDRKENNIRDISLLAHESLPNMSNNTDIYLRRCHNVTENAL